MSNYPPGAENDPAAPYNQKDFPQWVHTETGSCIHCDYDELELNDDLQCEDCFNNEQELMEEDDGADEAYDRMVDEQLEADFDNNEI